MANRYEDRERYDEKWRREGREDRGMLDRAGDEIRSWFGDEEAERRRRMDEQREGYTGGRYRGDFGRYENRYSREGYGGMRQDEEERRRERDYRGEHDYRREENYGREGYRTHPEDFSCAYNDSWKNRGYGQGWTGSGYTGWGSPWPSSEYGGYARGAYGREREYGRQGSGESRGRFAGRGPSGYRRSDMRVIEDINDRLTEDPYVDAMHIEVPVKDGQVTLTGSVDDRESKRRAEDLAETVTGVKDVQNHIRVGNPESSQPQTIGR